MTDTAALTIAIPTFNRREQVVPLAEAISLQLEPEDDLLVVDDGSTDGTAEALGGVPRVRLVRLDPNRGIVGAWNACLEAADRPWICIVHDDDEVAPDALATIRRACALARGPALVSHSAEGADLDPGFRYRHWEPGPYAVLHATMVPSGVTVHADVVRELGGFDDRFAYSPDLEYFARISARYPVVVIDSPQVIRFRLHEDNRQFETWRRPDFLDQLRDVEDVVMSYADLSDEAVAAWADERWTSHLSHMLRQAERLDDAELVRLAARELRSHSAAGGRVRLRAQLAAAKTLLPRGGE